MLIVDAQVHIWADSNPYQPGPPANPQLLRNRLAQGDGRVGDFRRGHPSSGMGHQRREVGNRGRSAAP